MRPKRLDVVVNGNLSGFIDLYEVEIMPAGIGIKYELPLGLHLWGGRINLACSLTEARAMVNTVVRVQLEDGRVGLAIALSATYEASLPETDVPVLLYVNGFSQLSSTAALAEMN